MAASQLQQREEKPSRRKPRPQTLTQLLKTRAELTSTLQTNPYSIPLYFARSTIHATLGYPDLAAGDAYKALLLCDEIADEEAGEYHQETLASLAQFIARLWRSSASEAADRSLGTLDVIEGLRYGGYEAVLEAAGGRGDEWSVSVKIYEADAAKAEEEARTWAGEIYAQESRLQLARCLLDIGCLRSAYDFVQQVLRADSTSLAVQGMLEQIAAKAGKHFDAQGNSQTLDESGNSTLKGADTGRAGLGFDPQTLPDRGFVRREVYPWNEHESDRTSPAALDLLNGLMQEVAPDLEVKVTELPVLTEYQQSCDTGADADTKVATVKQLGVFAKRAFSPGEMILQERSLLTADSKLYEPLCDACGAVLPGLNMTNNTTTAFAIEASEDSDTNGNPDCGPVPCDTCFDTVFCSTRCLDLAQESYHPAVCGMDVEAIAREVPAAEAADSLYTLLLLRALAMAQTQEIHPLDLSEVKYIWGDFVPPPEVDTATTANSSTIHPSHATTRTLPFSFTSNILLPLHMLEKMLLNPFTVPHDLSELWVYNTLLAKFRGTASGRVNPRDGRPEVAAVHPLWCLANHSCDPNVGWEWAGEIRFVVKKGGRRWVRKRRRDDEGEGQEVEEVEATREGRRGGIEAGEEVWSHYVDVDLPVKDRREWGMGALGGPCLCERCVWEAGN